MDGDFGTGVAWTAESVDGPAIEATSTEYLGRWNRLVSTTNWEKGRIICEWRGALLAAGLPAAACSDEAWSQRVGNVTPQHVGRLRRVYHRFGQVRDQYAGLYWSHFQAALEWSDAEMWLEGAVQNDWSVAQMQTQRGKTLSAVEAAAAEVPAPPEIDEDAPPPTELPQAISPSVAEVHDAEDEPQGDSQGMTDVLDAGDDSGPDSTFEGGPASDAVRPLENLPCLPQDLADAFEAFKLAIVHHRLAGWSEVSSDDVLAALDALEQLVLAPA
jgi:hypothetical protein